MQVPMPWRHEPTAANGTHTAMTPASSALLQSFGSPPRFPFFLLARFGSRLVFWAPLAKSRLSLEQQPLCWQQEKELGKDLSPASIPTCDPWRRGLRCERKLVNNRDRVTNGSRHKALPAWRRYIPRSSSLTLEPDPQNQ